jgi:hypothetical protein
VGSALFRHPDGIAACVAECRAILAATTEAEARSPISAIAGGK